MRKVKIDKDYQLTSDFLVELINNHKAEINRVEKLDRYYDCNNDAIMNRKYSNPNRPQNRISNGYAAAITDTAVGYLLGKPVAYTTENIKLLEKLTDINRYNDEANHNTTLAKNASKHGYGVEILYTDLKAKLRYKALSAKEVIVCYDNTLEENIILAVRFFDEKIKNGDNEETITRVEAYTHPKTEIVKGEQITIENGKVINCNIIDGKVCDMQEKEHYFNDVPVVVYENNDELYGDYEKSLTGIDAYDKVQSDTANDFEYITNCILVVSGEIIDEEARSNLDEQRVLNFIDSSGKAEYLMKDIKDAALENYKNRLNEDIHRFAQIPNMSDQNFANNSSGVAIEYKLMALENKTSVKEAKFRKGIMRRMELICNYLKVAENEDYDYLDVEPAFTRNKPNNLVEIADVMTKLEGVLSDETIISLFPQVSDVQAEIDRRNREKKEGYDNTFGQDYTENASKTHLNASEGDINE